MFENIAVNFFLIGLHLSISLQILETIDFLYALSELWMTNVLAN